MSGGALSATWPSRMRAHPYRRRTSSLSPVAGRAVFSRSTMVLRAATSVTAPSESRKRSMAARSAGSWAASGAAGQEARRAMARTARQSRAWRRTDGPCDGDRNGRRNAGPRPHRPEALKSIASAARGNPGRSLDDLDDLAPLQPDAPIAFHDQRQAVHPGAEAAEPHGALDERDPFADGGGAGDAEGGAASFAVELVHLERGAHLAGGEPPQLRTHHHGRPSAPGAERVHRDPVPAHQVVLPADDQVGEGGHGPVDPDVAHLDRAAGLLVRLPEGDPHLPGPGGEGKG